MTQTLDRQATATKVRPPIPQRIEPVRRQRRGYFAWMVSLVVLLVIAAAGFIVLQYIEETEVLPASGESVYAEFDWYENLEGFYLAPPAAAPSGESIYSGFGWANHLEGFYLAPPAAVGMGEIVYSEFDWYSDLGLYLRPPFSAAQAAPATAITSPIVLGEYSYALGTFLMPPGIDRFYALESIVPSAITGGYSYALGTFVPPAGILEGPR